MAVISKQALIRKELDGNWTDFSFPEETYEFVVKNLSNNDCFVSFVNNDAESASIKIAPGMIETISVGHREFDRFSLFRDTIYVKGTGEIEVRAPNTYISVEVPDEDASN